MVSPASAFRFLLCFRAFASAPSSAAIDRAPVGCCGKRFFQLRRLLCSCLALPFLVARADIQVAKPFGDHMVLQCDAPLPIWGTATAGETVTAEFAGQKKTTTANADGRWQLSFEPFAASAQPRVLSVSGSDVAHPLRFEDVLVGEVWLCSGGSNMSRVLGPREGFKPITRWQEEVSHADRPTLRLLNLIGPAGASGPAKEAVTTWTACSPESAKEFSAVAYFFARHLQEKLKVPVGILLAAEDDSSIDAWQSVQVGRKESASKTSAAAQKAAASHRISRAPGSLFEALIAQLIPYPIRGIAFYQGEADVDRSSDYQQAFSALISDWRTRWSKPELPFLFVQIAPFLGADPKLREAQLLTWQSTTNTAMIVTIDCGDIDELVPPFKQPVGERLALAARAIAYKENVEYSGPVYQSMGVEEDHAVLHFKHLGSGIAANDFSLMGFTMCGPDGIFHAAHGEIVGDTVTVSIPDVEKPVAVRYAWEKAPDGNLVNDAGLPASPFRTDRPAKSP